MKEQGLIARFELWRTEIDNLCYEEVPVMKATFAFFVIETHEQHSPKNLNCKEGRYSNGSLVSSEEGYYSTDSDENKHIINTYLPSSNTNPTSSV